MLVIGEPCEEVAQSIWGLPMLTASHDADVALVRSYAPILQIWRNATFQWKPIRSDHIFLTSAINSFFFFVAVKIVRCNNDVGTFRAKWVYYFKLNIRQTSFPVKYDSCLNVMRQSLD